MFLVRKLMPLILTLLFVFNMGGAAVAAAASQPISIYLNGVKIKSDVAPYIVPKANVTMVPLRVISESLKAKVGWTQSTNTATISKGELKLMMKVGQKFALVGSKKVPLDASVQLKNGRAMVPLRFVSEQLGLVVTWYGSVNTIKLESKDGSSSLKGAWISTVYNLDWPSAASYGNAEQQKQEFTQMLDELQGMGLNAVFVQVRPSADALYSSKLVPWTKFLTGVQGQDPGYDPLAFMIAETHRRGMAFHAWFNPFRANVDAKTDGLAPNHVISQHPDWIVNANGKLYINPGIPEARQHIIDVVMEVVKSYDIDGVHLDDYFYPTDGKFDDMATFAQNNSSQIANLDDWRRDNINQFVKQLGETIHKAKPAISYGISPFGVWRNSSTDPSGSDTKAGVETYDDMHADVRTWIQEGWIDYVMPQIYWSMTLSAARYDKLVDWWTNEVRGTNVSLYIGHAAYKLGTTETGWNTADEIINQLKYNEKYPEIGGDVYFSAQQLRKNMLGIVPLLQSYYKVGVN
ncbi:family 10 glycosylhydrolase [Cohnella yongneupensis]|uniref:Family 10 glycosylhydrolase n=1 Tax=Cohnella yongneupensis TaxID=425006 RepID=A0ABW0R104_9BACL